MNLFLIDKNENVIGVVPDGNIIDLTQSIEINQADVLNGTITLDKSLRLDEVRYFAVPDRDNPHNLWMYRKTVVKVENDDIIIQGVNAFYDDLKAYGYIKDKRPNSINAEQAVRLIIGNTRWNVDFVDNSLNSSTAEIHDINFYYLTYLDAIKSVEDTWTIEIQPFINIEGNKITRKYINLYQQMGGNKGKRFVYGENALQIVKESNDTDVYTALIGRGAGVAEQDDQGNDTGGFSRKITFADIEWSKAKGDPVDKPLGQEWVEWPQATKKFGYSDGTPRFGIVEFQNEEDPTNLLKETWDNLKKSAIPSVQFSATVGNVGFLSLGETVAIVRYDLDIKYQTRVTKIDWNRKNEKASQITLGDKLVQSAADRYRSVQAEAYKARAIADQATNQVNFAINNGGTTIEWGSNEPAHPKEGDIWYDKLPDGTVVMKQYVNGQWIILIDDTTGEQIKNKVDKAEENVKQLKTDADIAQGEFNKKLATNDDKLAHFSDELTVTDKKVDGLQGQITEVDNKATDIKNTADSAATIANDAMSSIQQAVANASSDAAKIRSDVAKVQDEINTAKTANSASVEALKSDIAVAKKDLAGVHDSLDQAQAAIEQKQKLINDSVAKISNDIEQDRKNMAATRDQLTIAQKSIADNRQALNSSVADINSGIEQDHKDLAAAQQANADTAKKLDSYTNQAIEQGKTIKKLQTDDDSTKMTIADIKGNVSQVQVNVTGLTANLKDANDNLATVKALADSLSATLTDHGKNIASLQATAKELSSTLGDADGRLSKVEQTAEEQSTTLSTVQGDLSQVKQTADGLTDTLKDAQGDITKVQATAKGLSEQITNAQGAITSLQTDVTGIKATITDHDKNIHTLQADAKSLTDNMTDAQGNISKLQKTSGSMESSLEDASGRLSKVEQTAKEHTSTLSDTQGDLSQVKQTADGLVTTLKDAQGNIDKLQQTAKGTAEQISSVQGDITSLQKDVSGIKATITDNENNIHTLQADSKTLKDDMTDAQGNISSLQKTATSLDSEFKDHDGRISKVEQTANTLTNELSDEQGHLNRVEQTANGTQQTVADHTGSIATLQSDANTLNSQMSSAQNDISTLKQTASGISSKVSGVETSLNDLTIGGTNLLHNSGNIQNWDYWKRSDANRIIQKNKLFNNGLVNVMGLNNSSSNENFLVSDSIIVKPNTDYTLSFDVAASQNMVDMDSFFLAKSDADAPDDGSFNIILQIFNKYKPDSKASHRVKATFNSANAVKGFLRFDNNGSTNGDNSVLLINNIKFEKGTVATDWSPAPEDTDDKITTNTTQIKQNKKEIDLKANQSTVNHLSGEVSQNKAQLKVQAGQISSKVSSEAFKTLDNKVGGAIAQIDKNTTAIDQTNNKISLKADQTEVDNVKGTASQNSSRLNTMANEIQSKVTSTDVNNIVNGKGYATTSTVQSLVTQKANEWNLNLTNLKTDVNAIKMTGGGVNLLQGTRDFEQWGSSISKVPVTNGQEQFQAATGTGGYSFDLIDFTSVPLEKDTDYTASFWVKTSENTNITSYLFDSGSNGVYSDGGTTNQSTTDYTRVVVHFHNGNNNATPNFIPVRINKKSTITVWIYGCMLEKGTVAHDWSPAPSDMATVTSVTNLSATVDGIKSTVANKADQSTVTQLSNVIQTKVSNDDYQSKITELANGIQSKVSSSNFDNLSKTVELQTLDSANINDMRTNGHYFVHNLANTPIQGWVYVDVIGNGNNRIRQDVYQDIGNQHCYRRWNDSWWTEWSKGATETQITQLSDSIQTKVSNADYQSKITELADAIQSKVSSSNFDNLSKTVELQTLDSADINNMRTNGHYFVHNLANTPIQGWVYVDVIGNGNNRIRQDVYQDIGNQHCYRRWNDSWWTEWSKGATETQITQLSDSIQTKVSNADYQSKITELADAIQSKVSSSNFDNLSKTVELQTLDSADINNMRTNGHYFVHNLANTPIQGWVYVDVVGNGNNRIRQDVYRDIDNQHCYRRWVGNWWTDWSQGATESEINQLSDNINLRVQKNDVINQINISPEGILIDGSRTHITGKTVIDNAAIRDAAISNLSASKLTVGVIDCRKIDVMNISGYQIMANQITADKMAANAIMVGLNNSLTNLSINPYGFNITENGRNVLAFNKTGMRVSDPENNEEVGWIHANHMKDAHWFNGLMLDVDYAGDYVGFGSHNESTHLYDVVFAYYKNKYQSHAANTLVSSVPFEFNNGELRHGGATLEFRNSWLEGKWNLPTLGRGPSYIMFGDTDVFVVINKTRYSMNDVIHSIGRGKTWN